ncbi:MAG: pyrroline-5-carboxylate reductase [Gammaproteobacteria bacterium]|nr:pyrroline-5-carboxylate reductase [Gammaproteobacteria bacterium]MDH5629727.1 pyrroline-5-carboxylate reductase [Gammaproteobacteria bacterium]
MTDNNLLSSINSKTIAFIGAGNMASAIIAGLIQNQFPSENILACNPSVDKLDFLKQQYKINTSQNNHDAVDFADIIVLSVKPQIIPAVCETLSKNSLNEKLLISVAAGFPTERLEKLLNQPVAIIRAMPNTPAKIQQGATGLFANEKTIEAQKLLAKTIFDSVGVSCFITDENHMNTVTAIAGSSPAYLFLMMEAMISQAVTEGMEETTARQLVSQSFSGAAQLVLADKETRIADMRKAVTSPKGTTEAAVNSFLHDKFDKIVQNAVKAAIERGIELGKG